VELIARHRLAATGFELAPFRYAISGRNRLTALPADLATIGVRRRFPLPHGRRDFDHGSTGTLAKGPNRETSMFLPIDGIEVKTRHFR
jgi:hypothetical protein